MGYITMKFPKGLLEKCITLQLKTGLNSTWIQKRLRILFFCGINVSGEDTICVGASVGES